MRSSTRSLTPFLALCLMLLTTALSGASGSVSAGHVHQPAASYRPLQASIPNPAGPAPPEAIHFEKISLEDGLSHPSVMEILQDTRGFMWFGTEDGLDKYDGYAFTAYRNDPDDPHSLKDNYIMSLYEDRSGRIWVATINGWLQKLDRKSGRFTHYEFSPHVDQMLEDASGAFWLATWEGLYQFDRELGQATLVLEERVTAIHEDTAGVLWAGTQSGSLLTYRLGNGFAPLFDLGYPVQSIHQDYEGVFWIGTSSGGLFRLDQPEHSVTQYVHDPDDPESLSDDQIRSICTGPSGSLWIGTQQGGLNWLDPESERFIRYRHIPGDPYSLSEDSMHAIYRDRSGVLWIGTTASGVNKLGAGASDFAHYRSIPNDPRSLGDNFVRAILEDRAGVLWMGTQKGLDRYDRQTREWHHYRPDTLDPHSLSHDLVWAIHEDQSGVIWIGTESGLDRYDQEANHFTHFPHPAVLSIEEYPQGILWLGTKDGVYRFEARTELSAKLGEGWVWTILADQTGILWVGTGFDGLWRYDPRTGEQRSYRHVPSEPDSLSDDKVLSIYEDRKGTLWIGTYGGGLARFQALTGTFTRYREKNGLANDTVAGILEDSQGYLWLSTGWGISQFDPRTETFVNYDSSDGLQGNSHFVGAAFQSASGEMFFGGTNGFTSFHPEQLASNEQVPPVIITSVSLFGDIMRTDLPTGEHIQLPHDSNSISFEFAALDYNAPQKNLYSYMMEGLDNDWTHSGTRRFAEYRFLRPGDYVFRVRGSNDDGLWNEDGVAVRVTIEPPFWATWWFRGIIAAALLGCAIAGYRIRIASIEARSHELERQVEQRTHEIERRRQELAALYRADEDLHRHLELDQVLQALVDTAVDILHADKGAVMVWDEERLQLSARATRGFQAETVARMTFSPGQGVAGRVALTGQPDIVEDTLTDPRASRHIVDPEGIRAFMQVPIRVGGEIFGVFSADYTQPRAFSDEERQLLVALAQRAALAITNAQRYQQAKELAVVHERNRLARELHDAVTQTLFSASLIAEALPSAWEADQEDGLQLLADLRKLSRGALAEMRTLLLELRPAAVVETKLSSLLRQLAEALTGREGIPVSVTATDRCTVPPDVHVALYRLAQEALNNVAKHARATKVDVILTSQCADDGATEEVELRVQDDGRGFDPGSLPTGRLGMGIMRERADAIGADLIIESEPGRGTLVRVIWRTGHV